MKTILYGLENDITNDNDSDIEKTMEQTMEQKEGLVELKSKLASYSADVDSTIQHMDRILSHNSSGG